MGETIHKVQPFSFPFKLQLPRMIAEETKAEEAQQEARPEFDPDKFQKKFKSDRFTLLTPWGALEGKPKPQQPVKFVSVLDVSTRLLDGRTYLGAEENRPILPLTHRWDEDYRATYGCEYYRNCANTVSLFEFRFELPD